MVDAIENYSTVPLLSDKFQDECGVFGVINTPDAAQFVALGLHALQHRGQEACGIVSCNQGCPFHFVHRFGYVRDNFTNQNLMDTLFGHLAIGHVRYSTHGSKEQTNLRNVQPFLGEFSMGEAAIAHNGNITNSLSLRHSLIKQGSIFRSTSDSECIIHLMARSDKTTIPERLIDALRQCEGAFSIVAMTALQLIGVRDPFGVRPLVLGRLSNNSYVLSSETCALDIIGAKFIRDINPGEMVVIDNTGVHSHMPFQATKNRFCVFEYIYFSRPDSVINARSVYQTRRQIGVELAREAPVQADYVCPIPDSGTPAAVGFSQESGIPYAMGIVRNQYVGRTFIEPSQHIRHMGVRLKLNVNRHLIDKKRIVLVDDSVVRGTTSRKIMDMLHDAGASEVHIRIASPPTTHSCYYGVDTPEKKDLLAANMNKEKIRDYLGADSLSFISLDGLYRAVGENNGRNQQCPQYCDACFSGDYPITIPRVQKGRNRAHSNKNLSMTQ